MPGLTETEAIVASVCATILGVEGLGSEDDIFQVGGDSMQAVQIALKLEGLLNVEIPIESLESAARVRDIAALIDRQRGADAVHAQSGGS